MIAERRFVGLYRSARRAFVCALALFTAGLVVAEIIPLLELRAESGLTAQAHGVRNAHGIGSAGIASAADLTKLGSKAVSGLSVQNRDCRPSGGATIVADFFAQAGGLPIPIQRPGVPPCASTSLYQPDPPAGDAGLYAVIVSADRPIATLERTDWNSTGASAMNGQSEASTDLVLPWVAKPSSGQAKSNGDKASIVSIHNTNPFQTARVDVSITPEGGTTAISVFERTIRPGTSVTLDFGVMRDIELVRLPAGFVGQMRVRSATPVAVQTFVDWETSAKGVAAFEGVPVERAAGMLVAPLIYNLAAGGRTWIAVANPGTAAADVAVSYRVRGSNCPAGPVIHGGRAHRIPAGAMAVFAQGSDNLGLPPATGDSGLPPGCSGTATIEALGEGKIVGIVVAEGGMGGPLAAYNAADPGDGGRQVLLPMVRNTHTADRMSTGIAAMNLGAAPATVALEVKDNRGVVASPCPECTQTIQPLESYIWYPPVMPSMQIHAGSYGSGRVLGDQPLAVVVNDASDRGSRDAAIYNGIPALDAPAAVPTAPPGAPPTAMPAPTAVPDRSFVPLYARNAALRAGDERPWVTARVFLPLVERH